VPAAAIGHITQADRALALMHCELYATWRVLEGKARRASYLVRVGEAGYLQPNPVRLLAEKMRHALVKVDAELGLTPTSLARVAALDTSGAADPTARFFA
jgi:phage terminase small subunit